MARVPNYRPGLIVSTEIANNNVYRIVKLWRSTHNELEYETVNIKNGKTIIISEDNIVKTHGMGLYVAISAWATIDMSLDTPEIEGPHTPQELFDSLEEEYDEEDTKTYTIFKIEKDGVPIALQSGYIDIDHETDEFYFKLEEIEKLILN